MTTQPDNLLERLHLHWFIGILARERSLMPSALRDDLMHPGRVALASMHQFARNATESGNDQLADDATAVAKQISALLEGQTSRPAAARPVQRVAQPTRPNPEQQ